MPSHDHAVHFVLDGHDVHALILVSKHGNIPDMDKVFLFN